MDDPEYYVCPFNSSHRPQWIRAEKHLLDCMKKYGMKGYFQCPYNALHVIPVENKLLHMVECVDKKIVEGKAYAKRTEMTDQIRGNVSLPPMRLRRLSNNSSVDDECWDDEDGLDQSNRPSKRVTASDNVVIQKNLNGGTFSLQVEDSFASIQEGANFIEKEEVSVGRGFQRNTVLPKPGTTTIRHFGRGRGVLALHTSDWK